MTLTQKSHFNHFPVLLFLLIDFTFLYVSFDAFFPSFHCLRAFWATLLPEPPRELVRTCSRTSRFRWNARLIFGPGGTKGLKLKTLDENATLETGGCWWPLTWVQVLSPQGWKSSWLLKPVTSIALTELRVYLLPLKSLTLPLSGARGDAFTKTMTFSDFIPLLWLFKGAPNRPNSYSSRHSPPFQSNTDWISPFQSLNCFILSKCKRATKLGLRTYVFLLFFFLFFFEPLSSSCRMCKWAGLLSPAAIVQNKAMGNNPGLRRKLRKRQNQWKPSAESGRRRDEELFAEGRREVEKLFHTFAFQWGLIFSTFYIISLFISYYTFSRFAL